MYNWFKKQKYKIAIALFSILSILTLFLGISKTYAYETNQFTYTISDYQLNTTTDFNRDTNWINLNNTNELIINRSDFSSGVYLYLKLNDNSFGKRYLFINYSYFDSNDNVITNISADRRNVIPYLTYKATNDLYYDVACQLNYFNDGVYTLNNNVYTQVMPFINTQALSDSNQFIYYYINSTLFSSTSTISKIKIYNIDIVKNSDIGLSQYYDTYYSQIEDNYNQLLDDYDTLQDNYEDLENDYNRLDSSYESLSSEYNDLQDDYTALLDNYNTIDNSLLSILVGNNYFTKSNINFFNTNSTNNVYPTPSGTLYNSTYFTNVDNSSLFDNILYTNIALSKLLDTQSFIFGDNGVPNIYTDKFSYITISPTYLMPYALKHYVGSADSTLHLLAYDYYQWNEPSNVMAKYINISIVSSIDLTISVNLINQDGSLTYLPISRDTNTQNYEIAFSGDDSRVVRDIYIECKYLNNSWVTAEKVISNINYVNDNNYTIGFNNGYDSGVTDMRNQVDDLNNQLIDANARITEMQLTINALNEQISSFSSDYGINNMLWTIGSTPFESFKQIWNVNLFGVNISRAITGFITAIIVLFVVKKFFL